jgi:AraC-like DNA-binding protein
MFADVTLPAAEIRPVYQNFAVSPLGLVRRAAFITHSPGLRRDRMRVLGSYGLVYVLRGQGTYQDANTPPRSVAAGDLLHLFPDLPHAYGPPDGETWDEFYLLFEGPAFDLWRAAGLLDPATPVRHLEPRGYWLKRLQEILGPPPGTTRPAAATDPTPADPLAPVCRLQLLLSDMLAHLRHGEINPADREWLAQAMDVLAEIPSADAEETLDWDGIASRLHMSYESFRKKFVRLVGTPPARYRTRLVMERAAALLTRSNMTLKEVSHECGFCNEFHFSRRFRQVVGLSPRDFRRQLPHDR